MKFFVILFFVFLSITSTSQTAFSKKEIPFNDPLFGKNGKVVTSIGKGPDKAEVVQVSVDGKIVVAGVADVGDKSDIAVVRYDLMGHIDYDFANRGKFVLDLGGAEEVHGLIALKDGSIIVGGKTNANDNGDFALIKLDSSGKLDKKFGKEGIILTHLGGEEGIHYLASYNNTWFVAVGYTYKKNNRDVAIAMYQLDSGQPVLQFNETGWVISDIQKNERAFGVAVDNKGGIYISGSYQHVKSHNQDCLVIRYLPNGNIDTTFSYGGIVIVPFGKNQDVCSSIDVSQTGKIAVAGFSERGSNNTDFAVAQLTAMGNLDLTFGKSGMMLTDFQGGVDVAHAVSYLKNDRILLSGESSRLIKKTGNYSQNFGLAYYLSNGKPDASFGENGLVIGSFGTRLTEIANGMALNQNGVILAGQARRNFGVMRYRY